MKTGIAIGASLEHNTIISRLAVFIIEENKVSLFDRSLFRQLSEECNVLNVNLNNPDFPIVITDISKPIPVKLSNYTEKSLTAGSIRTSLFNYGLTANDETIRILQPYFDEDYNGCRIETQISEFTLNGFLASGMKLINEDVTYKDKSRYAFVSNSKQISFDRAQFDSHKKLEEVKSEFIELGIDADCYISKFGITAKINDIAEFQQRVYLPEGLDYLCRVDRDVMFGALVTPSTLMGLGVECFCEVDGGYEVDFSLSKKLKEISDSAFEDSRINYVKLPESVKKIGRRAFMDSELREINTEHIEDIETYGFSGVNLKEVELNNIKHLGKFAFQDSSIKLLKTTQKEIVKAIQNPNVGSGAFRGCKIKHSLTRIGG